MTEIKKEQKKPLSPSIKITYEGENKMNINYSFTWAYRDDGPMYSCYVPGYDIFFSCEKDMEKVQKRTRAMVKSFFKYWITEEGKQGRDLKHFFLEIHKLGFRAEKHDFVLKRLLKKEIFPTKFDSRRSSIPNDFENSTTEEKGQLAVV